VDKTPSLTKALVGLTLLIAAIVGGYLALKSASDTERANDAGGTSGVIRYTRSGGFTGEATTLVLQSDGTGHVTKEKGPKKSVALSEKEMRALEEALDDAGLPRIGMANNPGGCADCYQYDITYEGARVVVFPPVPDDFRPALRALNRAAGFTG
jgi:hypothetical protein